MALCAHLWQVPRCRVPASDPASLRVAEISSFDVGVDVGGISPVIVLPIYKKKIIPIYVPSERQYAHCIDRCLLWQLVALCVMVLATITVAAFIAAVAGSSEAWLRHFVQQCRQRVHWQCCYALVHHCTGTGCRVHINPIV